MISLTATEVERRFGVLGLAHQFTDAEKRRHDTMLVVDQGDVFAFPTPTANVGLNLLNLRGIIGVNPQKQPAFFDHPWYLEEAFGHANIEPGWHFLFMAPLPDTIAQPIHYVRSLSARGLGLPTAIEIALMLFLHYVGSGQQLLLKKHTWCSDHASLHRFVTLGAFGRNGLFVSGHPADYASRGLGICPKLITPPTMSSL